MRDRLLDGVFLLGLAAIAAGVGFIYWPAGLICAGVETVIVFALEGAGDAES